MMTYNLRSFCLKFSVVAAFMLFIQMSNAQKNFSDFESSVEARKKDLGTDFVVAISSKDTTVYQKTFGEATIKSQMPLGAVSQWLTAAMIMVLVDEGKISLDDKISNYLPVYDKYFKSYITIRHCLTHMTGIKAEAFKYAASRKKFESLEAEVADYAKKEIQTNAGEESRYNGMGPNIAANIVEVVTKKKFDAIIKTKLFTPLGMRNTSFANDDGTYGDAAFGAKSTAADMSRFLRLLLNNGKANGKQILSEASVAEMKKIQVAEEVIKLKPKVAEDFSQGLSAWVVEGGNKAGDTGTVLAVPGFNGSWAMIDFSKNFAMVILPKSFQGEQKSNYYLNLTEVIR